MSYTNVFWSILNTFLCKVRGVNLVSFYYALIIDFSQYYFLEEAMYEEANVWYVGLFVSHLSEISIGLFLNINSINLHVCFVLIACLSFFTKFCSLILNWVCVCVHVYTHVKVFVNSYIHMCKGQKTISHVIPEDSVFLLLVE